MKLVELKDVSVVFRKGWLARKASVEAVSNVSLDLREGEILALVGESGCGKTTLGKVFLGLISPTSGKVLYMGKEQRPEGQLVHQDSYAALNPAKTIYQTLRAPLLRYGTKRSEVRAEVKRLLEFVGIVPPEYFMNKYPHHLSGGMRQRLLFARSIIPKPKFIVADEPVSMIDASLRLSILDLMMKLKEELGISFLYITHDLATARYIARGGRIAVMYLGKIVELGVLEDVFHTPMHPYLRALLAAAPIPDPKLAKRRGPLPLRSWEIPSADSFPTGCRFHPRCPYAEGICAEEEPPLRDIGDGHQVACHLAEVIPPWRLM